MTGYNPSRSTDFASTLLALGILATSLTGCTRGSFSEPLGGIFRTSYDKRGRLVRIAWDTDWDRQTDYETIMIGRRVAYWLVDNDDDGRLETRLYTGEETDGGSLVLEANPEGDLEDDPEAFARAIVLPDPSRIDRVEVSTIQDGTIDRWIWFEQGRPVRVEEDTNRDEAVDRWETWSDGLLSVATTDTDGDGSPDRRLTYEAGELVTIASSPDDSGEYRNIQVVRRTPPTASPGTASPALQVFIVGDVEAPGSYPLPPGSGPPGLADLVAGARPRAATVPAELIIVRSVERAGGARGPVLPEADAAAEAIRVDTRRLDAGSTPEIRDGDTLFVPWPATVYVTGGVKNPGAYPLEPGATVLQVIALAGGVTQFAATDEVAITRGEDTFPAKLTDPVEASDTVAVPER